MDSVRTVACWVLHKSQSDMDNNWHFLGDDWSARWSDLGDVVGAESWGRKAAREYGRPVLVRFGDEFHQFVPDASA